MPLRNVGSPKSSDPAFRRHPCLGVGGSEKQVPGKLQTESITAIATCVANGDSVTVVQGYDRDRVRGWLDAGSMQANQGWCGTSTPTNPVARLRETRDRSDSEPAHRALKKRCACIPETTSRPVAHKDFENEVGRRRPILDASAPHRNAGPPTIKVGHAGKCSGRWPGISDIPGKRYPTH